MYIAVFDSLSCVMSTPIKCPIFTALVCLSRQWVTTFSSVLLYFSVDLRWFLLLVLCSLPVLSHCHFFAHC